MTDIRNAILERRQALECMIWAGAGVVWTVAGGVPTSRLIGEARAEVSGFSFVQISDSHVGFEKPVNPDARATLREAIVKTLALPRKPAFMIHTGDISHAAKADEFDDAVQIIGEAKLDVHYAPGEHDILDPRTHAAYLARFGKGAKDGGWYAFDQAGVHFVSLVNVVDLGKNGLGALGPDQLAWLDADLRPYARRRSSSSRIFPLDDRAGMGTGASDSAQALQILANTSSASANCRRAARPLGEARSPAIISKAGAIRSAPMSRFPTSTRPNSLISRGRSGGGTAAAVTAALALGRLRPGLQFQR